VTPRRSLLHTAEPWEQRYGAPAPLGVTYVPGHDAFNFALYSRHATEVTLLAYAETDLTKPLFEHRFLHPQNRTGTIWHCWVPASALAGATLYGYRIGGPPGHRFDPDKVLLDPYAPAVFFPPGFNRDACAAPGRTDGRAPLGVLPSADPAFAWDDAPPPRHDYDAVIYELHVRGFTARANSGVAAARRGTFAGLTDKIPYLLELGVTVVELLPVQQHDPQEGNYWGYMTMHFFSPHRQYAAGDAFGEFREMVKAFHRAGIEVWLDVVYNHTSEGGPSGPTYSFRGIDDESYYLLEPGSRAYVDDTGCGNTTRCGHPAMRALVLSSLRFWIREMRVDGFRFDLASIFSRASDGSLGLRDAPLIPEISFLASSADVRLVAEAWDIASYQLGRGFPGVFWLQWNGAFRDDLRAFVKGDPDKVGALMRRLYGSDDLFPDEVGVTYRPHQSVNFVTAHDGFCLYDLVSYNQKHNEANGHGNQDGSDHNLSWNCGVEGDDGAPAEVLALRRRQVKNFGCLLLLANGTPMMAAGDEFMNTQRGNNNPYNQDNETTWLDWGLLEANRDVFRFFRLMIAFRKAHPSISRGVYWRDDVRWYGTGPQPDLGSDSHSLAYCLQGATMDDDDLYVMVNAWSEDLEFEVQEGAAGEWLRVVDTSLPSPRDILEAGSEERLDGREYRVDARSVVVLRRRAC
jgi:isoamylase